MSSCMSLQGWRDMCLLVKFLDFIISFAVSTAAVSLQNTKNSWGFQAQ